MKNIFAKNRWKNLHKHPGPPFQIRPGPGYFSRAKIQLTKSDLKRTGGGKYPVSCQLGLNPLNEGDFFINSDLMFG